MSSLLRVSPLHLDEEEKEEKRIKRTRRKGRVYTVAKAR
jgi:hypothetical protein